MLVKMYGNKGDNKNPETRYSPGQCIGTRTVNILGERQNLSVRMANRRYTRLTNAFSKKIENHTAAVALYYFAYNFIKIHGTLRLTPAMAAGVTNRL
jgi:hypothetical protein